MKGWAELKDAFWAAIDGDPAERARTSARLAAIDPALSAKLDALLKADDRGEALQNLFQPQSESGDHPSRIGVYDIIGVLGRGGMGEVYRARDARLQRDVAIKILPAALATDRDRLARFEREAQVLASLNHRHIAHVYGLEDSGRPALVMELVPGPTLANVIAGAPPAPLTLPKTLAIARQIADGLDAAHERGVIHRDLKPSNVALTEDGEVKILDFGLAKSLDARLDQTNAAMTDAGTRLGTPAYMSPEQARGLTVDRRTDVWAFGCVLYELLTGQQAFVGKTASDILAAVLERDPDLTLLPASTPGGVRSLLRHCLEKDAKLRLRDIADGRFAIDDVLHAPSSGAGTVAIPAADASRAAVRNRVVGLVAGVAIAAAAGVAVQQLWTRAAPDQLTRRTVAALVLPRGVRLAGPDLDAQASEFRFAVSPDGRKLALTAAGDSSRTQLWLRDLSSAVVQPLAQTEDASFPFWSPDSAAIGFVAGGKLKTIRLSDGTVTTIADPAFRLGAWSRNNVILFAAARSSPLQTVPASGGAPTIATNLDTAGGEEQHGYPAFLPDGRHFLYFSIGSSAVGALDPRGVYLGSLDTNTPAKLLIPGATQARYANGHLLFVKDGTLMAQAFDAGTRELGGAPSALVEDIKLNTFDSIGATAAFSVSDNGVLVYQAALRMESRPTWLDRSGQQVGTIGPPADYSELALSPDGTRLAVSVVDPTQSTRDIWLYDVNSGRSQRLTFETGDEIAPAWSPDGERLLVSAVTKGVVNLQIIELATGSKALTLAGANQGLGRFAADWSRDGRSILFIAGGRAIARSDLWVAPLSDPKTPRALLESPFVETQGRFAPKGPWFAYATNETGPLEVYVDRYPDLGAKRRVSTAGGHWPRWSSNGDELFYVSPDNQLMSAAVHTAGTRLEIGVPRPLFTVRLRPTMRLDAYPYDVSPDGQRFVINAFLEDATATAITLVLNWPVGLSTR